jgi:hypothetical protein
VNARFLTRPELGWVDGRYPWALIDELVYVSPILAELGLPKHEPGVVRIAAGYCTDFASVPRLPIIYWWTGGRAVLPALVHDHLYDCWTDAIPRKVADRVFLEAMAAERDPERWITRRVMYTGVRLGGRRPWHTDTTHKCPGAHKGQEPGRIRA